MIMEIFCLFCWRALQNPLFKESFINFEVNEVMERIIFCKTFLHQSTVVAISNVHPHTILQLHFSPRPGYKSATIWCLLDNDESGCVCAQHGGIAFIAPIPKLVSIYPPSPPYFYTSYILLSRDFCIMYFSQNMITTIDPDKPSVMTFISSTQKLCKIATRFFLAN